MKSKDKKNVINLSKVPRLTFYYAITSSYKIIANEPTPEMAQNVAISKGIESSWIVPANSVKIYKKYN